MTHPPVGETANLVLRQAFWDVPGLLRQASTWGLTLLLALASWLLVRRGIGALADPLGGTELLATALLLSIWSGAVRWAWIIGRGHQVRMRRTHHVFPLLTSAGVLGFGLALSLPGLSPGMLVVFWGALLAVEVAWCVALFGLPAASFRSRNVRPEPPSHGSSGDPETIGSKDASGTRVLFENGEDERGGVDGETGELLDQDEWQRISRVRDSLRGEVLSGLVRCAFAPGERQHDVHLAFCPPLRHAPYFSVEQVGGPPARIRASVVESFGVGVEIKLASVSSEPATVQVQFFACEEPLNGEAN